MWSKPVSSAASVGDVAGPQPITINVKTARHLPNSALVSFTVTSPHLALIAQTQSMV
jgi:hypothetical protein